MSGQGTPSEWMKIMLEEIARKKAEEDQMRAEEERRRDESSSARSVARVC
ncbi:MAG: hypothetical protein ABI356_11030 [Steroidobacteraceae bacterium]